MSKRAKRLARKARLNGNGRRDGRVEIDVFSPQDTKVIRKELGFVPRLLTEDERPDLSPDLRMFINNTASGEGTSAELIDEVFNNHSIDEIGAAISESIKRWDTPVKERR